MSGAYSRNKGKRAEREVIELMTPAMNNAFQKFITDYPHLDCGEQPKLQRNTLQSDAGGYDIVGIPWLALEVKNQAKGAVDAWWKQCLEQASKGQTPVLWYRIGGQPWRVRMAVTCKVVDYRAAWVPVVDMSPFAWLDYFEIRLYDELGKNSAINSLRRQMQSNDWG